MRRLYFIIFRCALIQCFSYVLSVIIVIRVFQYWSSAERVNGWKYTSFSSEDSSIRSSPAALIIVSSEVCRFLCWIMLFNMLRPSLARAAVGCLAIMRGAAVESSQGCSCARAHSGMVLISTLSVALNNISFLQMLQCTANVIILSNMGEILSFMSVKKPFEVDCAANLTGMPQRLSTPFRSLSRPFTAGILMYSGWSCVMVGVDCVVGFPWLARLGPNFRDDVRGSLNDRKSSSWTRLTESRLLFTSGSRVSVSLVGAIDVRGGWLCGW